MRRNETNRQPEPPEAADVSPAATDVSPAATDVSPKVCRIEKNVHFIQHSTIQTEFDFVS